MFIPITDARTVDQRPAGIARVDGGVGLHHVDEGLGAGAGGIAGLHGAALGRDDPLGHRGGPGGEPEGISDGDHRVAHLDVVRVAVGHRGQVGLALDLEQGHVVGRIGVDQGGRERLQAAVQGHGDGGGAGDDVVVGDHLAVGGDDHPRALVLLHGHPSRSRRSASEAGSGDFASMETTAGSTLSMTDSMLVVPLRSAGPAEIIFTVVPPPSWPDGLDDLPADHRADQGGDEHHRRPQPDRRAPVRPPAAPVDRVAGGDPGDAGRPVPITGPAAARALGTSAGTGPRARTLADGVGGSCHCGRKEGGAGCRSVGTRRRRARTACSPVSGPSPSQCPIVCPQNHSPPPVFLVRGRTTVRSCRRNATACGRVNPHFRGFLTSSRTAPPDLFPVADR